MANENDVLAAWLKIAREDTGPGSLVTLTGKAEPAVTWMDADPADLPVIALPIPVSTPMAKVPYTRTQTWRPEVRVPRGALKLAHQLMDRLEQVTTWSAFNAESLDIRVTAGTRAPGETGDLDGYRLIATYTLEMAV